MTDSEIYQACSGYSSLRAKRGCSEKKSYWATELRTLIACVNHEIIMARSSMGKGERSPELQIAYADLRTAYEKAIQYVDLRAAYEKGIQNISEPVVPKSVEPTLVAMVKTLPGGLKNCPECGSDDLSWQATVKNKTGVQQGRLRTNEVGGIFYLGCGCCSATVWVLDSDKVADFLNKCRSELYS